ncbi:hypothetical protein [Microbulbifer hainanensis]|uniref:hypothetical protein n=1 Tax=Microbulbifer hainanensis TaxID=2735675 RepID=UPI001867481C|nr:hypothetical protein [Microbulbifer hainanensis]
MKIFLTIVSSLFAVLQGVIAYYWTYDSGRTGSQFFSMLQSIYGQVPNWSEMAFSLGVWWYGVAAVIAIASIAVNFFPLSKSVHVGIFVVSLATVVSMVYAMYPIHLMASGDII